MSNDRQEIIDIINSLLDTEGLRKQIDRNFDQSNDIADAVRKAIVEAIASQYPDLKVNHGDICIYHNAGKIEVNFDVTGTAKPPKLFLIYDKESLYNGQYHYHSQGD